MFKKKSEQRADSYSCSISHIPPSSPFLRSCILMSEKQSQHAAQPLLTDFVFYDTPCCTKSPPQKKTEEPKIVSHFRENAKTLARNVADTELGPQTACLPSFSEFFASALPLLTSPVTSKFPWDSWWTVTLYDYCYLRGRLLLLAG